MSGSFSQELLAAQAQGAVIVAASVTARGTPVRHDPRRKGDPRPWVATDGSAVRFSGRDCRPVTGSGAPWVAPKEG